MTDKRRFSLGRAVVRVAIFAAVVAALPVFGQDSLNMSRLGRLQEWWVFADDVIVEDHYAVVLTDAPGIVIYDLSNPAAPRVASRVSAWGYYGGMAKSGNLLLSTGILGGFYDVTEPESPVVLDNHFGWGQGKPAIWGNHAYAPADGGFYVWDITDPANPVRGWQYDDNRTELAEVAAYNGYLYFGDHYYYRSGTRRSIRIFDLSDPAHPALIADSIPGTVYDFEIDDHYFYMLKSLNSVESLQIFDLTLPNQPELVGTLPLDDHKKIAVDNGQAVAVDYDLMTFINVENPAEPAIVTSQAGEYYSHDHGFDLQDGVLFFAGQTDFSIFDLSDLEHPSLLTEQSVSPLGTLLSVRLPYVTISTFDGYDIFDVSNERNPLQVGHADLSGWVRYAANDLLFTEFSGHLWIYSTESLFQPQLLGNFAVESLSSYTTLATVDNFLYINDQSRFFIYDIANPASPELVVSTIYQNYRNMMIESPLAVFWGWDSLKVMDITNPAEPTEIAAYPYWIPNADSFGVAALVNSVMYFTHESHHGGIIDLRNPAQPEVYDNAWLDSATHIAGYDTDYLYVATGYDPEPVIVLDIHSDPVNPQSVGYYPTFVNSAIRNDDRLYACDDYSFQILSLFGHFAADKSQAPFISSFTLHSAYPNPFNGVTTIRFELPRSVPVVYDVFNALGQQVTSRDLGVLNGGEQRVSLDANGWGSGSYWVRLQAGADVLGTKIVLLK